MDIEKIETKNGEYLNVDFKKMDIGDDINVTPIQVIKTGEGKFGIWRLFKYNISGKEITGFQPNKFIGEKWEKNLGKTYNLSRYFDKGKSKVFYENIEVKEEVFEFSNVEKQVIDLLKESGKLDKNNLTGNLKDNIEGITEDRINKIVLNLGL